MQISAIPVFDSHGVFVGYRGSGLDISEQKQAQDALRSANEELEKRVLERTAQLNHQLEQLRLETETRENTQTALEQTENLIQAVMDHAPIEITVKDTSGRYVQVNQIAETFGSSTGATLKGKRSVDHLPRELVDLIDAQERVVVETKQTVEHEHVVPRGDEERILNLIKFPLLSRDGEVSALGTLGVDVTEHRLVTQNLHDSQERFRDFARSAADWFWEMDADWFWEMDADLRFTYLSERFEEITGLFIDQVVGKTREEAFADYIDDELKWAERRVQLESREKYEMEWKINRSDGSTRTLHTRAIPIFDDHGGFRGYRGVGADITERKRMESIVLRAERLTALGQLTATVAHELRNPLGSIRSSIAVIRRLKNDDTPLITDSIDIVERNISRCNRLVDDLLDFAQTKLLKRELLNMDRWLAGVLDWYSLPSGLRLHRKLSSGVELRIDGERLERAIHNLLDNACHAMLSEPEQTHSDNIQGNLTVSTRKVDNGLELTVADTGHGMTPDVLDKAFEPLFTTKSFGAGLGLSTVRQIVELHDGRVDLNSRAGGGARVVITLLVDAVNGEASSEDT